MSNPSPSSLFRSHLLHQLLLTLIPKPIYNSQPSNTNIFNKYVYQHSEYSWVFWLPRMDIQVLIGGIWGVRIRIRRIPDLATVSTRHHASRLHCTCRFGIRTTTDGDLGRLCHQRLTYPGTTNGLNGLSKQSTTLRGRNG